MIAEIEDTLIPLARAAREILSLDTHEVYRLAREGKIPGAFKVGKLWFVAVVATIRGMQGEEPDVDPFEGIVGSGAEGQEPSRSTWSRWWYAPGQLPPPMSWFKRSDPAPDKPRSFGYKTQWLAVRHDEPMRVAEAIGLRKLKVASWAMGMRSGFKLPIFVTPVLDGWILVVEFPLPDDGVRFLERASAELHTQVCQFASYRGVSAVSWGIADDGQVHRLYTHSDGKTYTNHGAPMPEEVDLGLRYSHELNGNDDVSDEEWDKLPNERTVLVLAGKWSIDPMTIEERFTSPSLGWIGKR